MEALCRAFEEVGRAVPDFDGGHNAWDFGTIHQWNDELDPSDLVAAYLSRAEATCCRWSTICSLRVILSTRRSRWWTISAEGILSAIDRALESVRRKFQASIWQSAAAAHVRLRAVCGLFTRPPQGYRDFPGNSAIGNSWTCSHRVRTR